MPVSRLVLHLSCFALLALSASALPCASPLLAQAVVTTGGDGDKIVVFPTPEIGLPDPDQFDVTGLPGTAGPHGVAWAGAHRVLIADGGTYRVFYVDLETGTVLNTIDTLNTSLGYGALAWSAWGTIAVSPNRQFALGAGYFHDRFGSLVSDLAVIQAPFGSGATIKTATLPNAYVFPANRTVDSYNTEAIAFDPSGRAYILHSTGIAVLDPPYILDDPGYQVAVPNQVFSIPASGWAGGGITLSADGLFMLTTGKGKEVYVFEAPFSATSAPTSISIDEAHRLSPIALSPDGKTALLPDALGMDPLGQADFPSQVHVIHDPLAEEPTVETIALPSSPGFEHAAFSGDGELAILVGGGGALPRTSGFAAIFLEPPYTAAKITIHEVPVGGEPGVGRGAGAVVFGPWAVLFADGFESGDTLKWSSSVPP